MPGGNLHIHTNELSSPSETHSSSGFYPEKKLQNRLIIFKCYSHCWLHSHSWFEVSKLEWKPKYKTTVCSLLTFCYKKQVKQFKIVQIPQNSRTMTTSNFFRDDFIFFNVISLQSLMYLSKHSLPDIVFVPKLQK